MKFSLKGLLNNQIVLYIVLFISVTSVFSYLMSQNYAAVLFFLTIAFLTNYFSKNMIIILGIAVLSTSALSALTNVFNHPRFIEGLTNKEKLKKTDTEEVKHEETKHAETKPDETKSKEINANKPKVKELNDTKKSETKEQVKCNATNEQSCNKISGCQWNKGKCNQSSKTGFTNINPASYPNNNKEKPNIDEAGTLEAAYDNLENVIGTDAVRSMSEDTKNLANRQKELINQIKDIGPLISETTKMIGSFNVDGKLQNMIDGLTKNIGTLNKMNEPKGVQDPSPA